MECLKDSICSDFEKRNSTKYCGSLMRSSVNKATQALLGKTSVELCSERCIGTVVLAN